MQGAFGAALAPLSQSVIIDINPPQNRGQAMAIWGAGIMVAPIIGPTIGAWLTEDFNWRWVFYINIPIGLAALVGIFLFMPDTVRRIRRFDFFGFAMLSLAVGAFQFMLDRGAEQDWFSSWEIVAEGLIAVAAAWAFIVHTITDREPFVHRDLFTDRNFAAALVFIFVIGIILLATMALLPPMLTSLLGYPVIAVGLVLAPRGLGTMVSMLFVGRVVARTDPRLLVLFGLSLTAYSLWQMTFFTADMGSWPIITSGVIQGFGLGFVFIPLSTIAFQTLSPALRTEASSLFNLVRNLGSSIGVSIMATMLTRNIATSHASLVTHITPFNDNLLIAGIDPNTFSTAAGQQTAAMIDGMITGQAAMIAYLDDFRLMFWITLCAAPLLLILKHKPQTFGCAPGGRAAEAQPAAAMAD
jgi:DHA2 family multidrug resistance protein